MIAKYPLEERRYGQAEIAVIHKNLAPEGAAKAAETLNSSHNDKNQFNTHTAARISPNSRAILRQDVPASSVT
jgi:hypothetical protein